MDSKKTFLFKKIHRHFYEGNGEAVEEGSPLIALTYPFSQYIYIESDEENSEALKKRCKKSPKLHSIEIISGDCNKVVDQIKLAKNDLALVFIDPTGIDIHFNTIRALTLDRRVDILMNIPFGMDIKRGFKIYKEKRNRSKLDRFLGGNVDWNGINSPQDVLKIYKKRIADLGYTTVEYRDIIVKNTKNAPMYFLFFASRHPRGVEFWEKITRKDESGQFELF